jgi:hypothetical protein
MTAMKLSWLSRFCNRATGRNVCRPVRRKTTRPALEPLEERCVPTAGMLDLSYDSDGVVTTAVGGVTDIAIQADGKTLAAGHVYNGSNNSYDFGVVRYNTNGSLDTTFGSGGMVLTQFFNPNRSWWP